ncbi:MAG: SGNH hydrolase domain-containing protein [Synechococcus sp.]
MVLTWCGLDALGFTYRGAVFQGSRSAFVPKSDRFSLGGCTVDPWVTYGPETQTDLVKCSQAGSNPAAGEIFLMGDSHALAMLPMLKTAAKSTGQKVTYSFKGSCLNSSRLVPTLRKKAYGPCVGYSRGEFERTLKRLNPGDSLMISNWFNVYLTDITVKGRANTYPYVVDGERLEDHAKVREIYIADMRALASQLQQKGINLILVVDPPVLRREPVACEAWAYLQGPENRSLLCSPDPKIVAQMQQTQRDVFDAVAKGHPNVRVFDPTEEFLQNGRVTHLLPDGQLRYFDSNHMTISGSQSLAPRFLDFLRANGLDRSNAG